MTRNLTGPGPVGEFSPLYIISYIKLYSKGGALYSPTISIRRIDCISHASLWHDVTSDAASRVEIIFLHAVELVKPAIRHPVGASEIFQRRAAARSKDAASDVQDKTVIPFEGVVIHERESKS